MAILTELSRDEIHAVAGVFGLTPVSHRGVLAGSVNTNYEVGCADGRRYFVRVYEEQAPAGAAREARLLELLSERGVPTPRPVPRADGAGHTALVRDKAAVVFPFIPGDIRCQARVTQGDARRVGAALAQVHLVGETLRESSLTGPSRFDTAALRERLASLDANTEELDRARERIARTLDEVESEGTAPTVPLVHGDLFRDNVLFDDEGRVTLLDFESASTGLVSFDVSVTLLAWCYGDDLDVRLTRAMVSGYVSVRPIALPERADLFRAARFACARFATTRIGDYELRPRGLGVYKDFRRWMARMTTVEELGSSGFSDALGLG